MPPKGSKKAAAKESPPIKKAAVKKSPSPVKGTAAVKKVAKSPTKSPIKQGPASIRNAVKKSTSPAKNTSSPAKAQAIYKTAMTRGTRATSAAPSDTTSAPVARARHAKKAFQKRGLIGTEDNDDDPTQPTDEMLAAFDKASLTDMDQYLIEGILVMEEDEDARVLNRGKIIYKQELVAASHGLPLDCHTKIYWRFNDMFARRNEDYMHEYFAKTSPVKPASRTASRSPSKPRSPSKTLPGSPERKQRAMSRPLRRDPSNSPEASTIRARVTGPSRNVGVNTRITRTTPAGPGRASRSAGRGLRDTKAQGFIDSFERLAYQMALKDKGLPEPPQDFSIFNGDPADLADFFRAMQEGHKRGREEAKARRAEHLALHVDESDQVVEIEKPASRKPSIQKPRSPVKQAAARHAQVSVTGATPKDFGRGTCISFQNPPEIVIQRNGKTTSQPNPFFETMPAPAVWHRRMAPVFPFGETPYMAKVVSDQINADLSRSK